MAPDDPCASSDFREYTCLLIRNLAMQRGNKGRLVAMGNKNLSSASVLRFLGYVRDHRPDAETVPTPPLTISDVWGSEHMGAWVESYMAFLATRDVKWCSQSNYVAGLVNVMYWAEADPDFEETLRAKPLQGASL